MPELPTSPPGQSDNEKRCLLREKLDRQIPQHKALEQKIAEKVKGLKSLHSHVKNANNLHSSIEESVAQLAALGEEYFVEAEDIPNNTMMNYCFGREKLGVLDVFWDRGVLFTSELLDGIVEEVQPDFIDRIDSEARVEDGEAESDAETTTSDASGDETVDADGKKKRKTGRNKRSLTR
jgi:translation elongation factor EF-G